MRKMANKVLAISVCSLVMSTTSYANEDWVRLIEPKAESQVWINPGMVSYHFQKDKDLNNGNWGGGLEYRFNTVASLTAGRFYNSNRGHSNYAGVYYQPLAIGPIQVGAVIGGFNGYQNTNNGGWFPALVPAVTWEGKWVGANVFFSPTVADKVNGAISLQVKFKVFDAKGW